MVPSPAESSPSFRWHGHLAHGPALSAVCRLHGLDAPCHLSSSARQPQRRVADVRLDIFECLRVAFVAIAGRLDQKTRTTHVSVPVVIHQMMKTGFGNSAAQPVSVRVARAFKGNEEIERAARYFALARGNNGGVIFTVRNADRSFMRMSRKKLNQTRRLGRVAQKLMLLCNRDSLIVAIGPRMIVGPGD